MDNWAELSRTPLLRPPRDPGAQPQHVTCTLFDEQSDLIWAGDSAGFIASYADTVMAPYTRFPAHTGPVLQMLSHSKGVLSTDGVTLRLTNRRGLLISQWSASDFPEFATIYRVAITGPSEALVSTGAGLVRFDLTKSLIVSITPCPGEVMFMQSNKRHVAVGKRDGTVDIFDVKSGTIVHTFFTNSSTLSDMDLKEQTLVTCGKIRRHGVYSSEQLVNVFDLRSMRPVAPISFPSGALFVRLHPKLPSVVLIASKIGQMHSVDMFDQSRVYLYQIDVGPSILSFEISSTGDFLSVVDAFSLHHLWAHNPEHSTMSNRAPLEYPPIPEQHERIDIDDDSKPLNIVGMPYYKEQLLSAWPSQTIFKSAGTITKSIDQSIIRSARQIGPNVFEAPYDKEKYGKRNQVKKYVPLAAVGSAGKFLSSKMSSPAKRPPHLAIAEEDVFNYKPKDSNEVPNAFKKLEILYSKFGIDDFDFDYYNKTTFSGLECHVDNSYTNASLQLYRFVPEMFNFAVGNLANENLREDSLLTELGYLFDMLVKADGKHYRPTNFQHMLSSLDEAVQNDLIERDGSSAELPLELVSKSQRFNAFLLRKLAIDEFRSKEGTSLKKTFNDLFGVETKEQSISIYSNMQNTRATLKYHLDVMSPAANNFQRPQSRLTSQQHPSVVEYLESSMARFEQTRIQDSTTSSFDIRESIYTVTRLPPVLSCNLIMTTEEKRLVRNTPGWLKTKFQAVVNSGRFTLAESFVPKQSQFFLEYDLVGFVAEISGESQKDSHLVTFVKMEKDGEKNWYLFNDFLVIPVPEAEVLNVSYWWKTPVTLVYRKTSTPPVFDYNAWENGLNDEILYRDMFARGTRESKKIEYELLTRAEAPRPGSLVAIDTEFVTLEEEQYEIKSNGTRSLLKPSNQALARVSVLRGGDGEKFGVPFIDDWVVVKERIHDYLTSYSGIEPGDLDPETSNKALVSAQTVYRKLWLLLNLGCVFVGHGLIKDFRTINISVPKSQVRDTAVFFYKGQRILSLRFLAYVLLGKKVQEGNHDSIEDAHTALLLYKKYEELQQHGDFEDVLDYVYQEGQMLRFKPPGED